jgi:hypothetical protein
MIPFILFCLSVGLAASVVVTLDFVTKSKEPYEALWTREVWLLYLFDTPTAKARGILGARPKFWAQSTEPQLQRNTPEPTWRYF